MSERLSWEEYGCLLALSAKSRSEDHFTKIGGVAFDKNHRVLGCSYNGLKSGREMPSWMKLKKNRQIKSDLFIHCESNLFAMIKKGECHSICLTQSPCIKCCQQIVALDVKLVIYLKEYQKCNKFKEFLDFHGIEYKQLSKKNKNNILKYIKNLNNFSELE